MTKIFILHGWTYQIETWQPLLDMLSARGVAFEFLLIPGLTDGTDPVWTLDDYVKWLEEKTAAYDKVILYGHSNGGRISLAYTAKHPEKVELLILEDSAGIPARGLRSFKKNIFKAASRVGKTFTRSEKVRKLLYKLIRVNDYSDATPNMKETMANLLSVDLSLVLDRIHAPTLIIWGANDRTTPLSDGKLLHRGIRGSRMIVIPDARHSPHITHVRELADLIEKELKQS